jgi:serine/threonine protein kinase
MTASDSDKLIERIQDVTGWFKVNKPEIVTDTSDFMRIHRGHLLRLENRDYIITGNEHETRFGIREQPKFWVFGAYDLQTGDRKIIKTVLDEDFHVHISIFKIHCYRSPEKESRVLDLTRGDKRFMQGYTVFDDHGNPVRIIDYIRGSSLFNYIFELDRDHEQYFHEDLPIILKNLVPCFEAIQFLHENDICHGDIRNDHIIIETGTGLYRWIDFDLNQNVADFDIWSMGNIINYVAGKGITSFHGVLKGNQFPEKIKNSLTANDASAFYEYRIMNLKKLYPYIPDSLNRILMHFSTKPSAYYSRLIELIDDFKEMLEKDFSKK